MVNAANLIISTLMKLNIFRADSMSCRARRLKVVDNQTDGCPFFSHSWKSAQHIDTVSFLKRIR